MVSGQQGWVGAAWAVAAALWCWPGCSSRYRLAALLARPGENRSRVGGLISESPGRRRAGFVIVAGALGALCAGAGGAVAAGAGAAVAAHRWQAARRRRQQAHERAALVDAIGVMAAELRAGAHPATAALAACEAADHGDAPRAGPFRFGPARPTTATATAVRRVLGAVAAGARLGAEVPALLHRYATAEAVIGDEMSKLAAAWSLAERHGVALADLLEAARGDLESRTRLAGQIGAQLAGPKSTASVLAGLPVLGVVMGQGIGAGPWRVLTGTPIGQALLVVGTALTCAGVLWSGRITSRAVPQ
jgi:tight adherence protein B